MKKFFALFLAFAFCSSLAIGTSGCGKTETKTTTETKTEKKETTPPTK